MIKPLRKASGAHARTRCDGMQITDQHKGMLVARTGMSANRVKSKQIGQRQPRIRQGQFCRADFETTRPRNRRRSRAAVLSK